MQRFAFSLARTSVFIYVDTKGDFDPFDLQPHSDSHCIRGCSTSFFAFASLNLSILIGTQFALIVNRISFSFRLFQLLFVFCLRGNLFCQQHELAGDPHAQSFAI